jgi:hypothetical protein
MPRSVARWVLDAIGTRQQAARRGPTTAAEQPVAVAIEHRAVGGDAFRVR